MADALYTRLAATALRLLAKYGQAVTLRSYTSGTYDPATLSATPSTSDSHPKAIILPYSAGQVYISGGLVDMSDQVCYMDPTASPNMKDHIIDAAGTEYVIKSIKEISPAGVPVLLEIQLTT